MRTSTCSSAGAGIGRSSMDSGWVKSLTTAAFMSVISMCQVVSEQAGRLGVVAHEQALGLRVVVEHHPVVLPADARGLVAAERGMGGVLVVTVGPHAAGLDRTSHAEGAA